VDPSSSALRASSHGMTQDGAPRLVARDDRRWRSHGCDRIFSSRRMALAEGAREFNASRQWLINKNPRVS
jgi:hypothetical protein